MAAHPCPKCGKEYKSRSGVWKHEQKCQVDALSHTESSVVEVEEGSSMPPADSSPLDTDTAGDTSSSKWMDFDLGGGEIEYTDSAPAPLKILAEYKPKDHKKMSVAELKSFKETEKAMLKMMLGGIDAVLTTYGKAVCLDPDFIVKHSESSKEMVSSAQYAYMEEKGVSISKYASKGMLAGALTTWYVAAPIMRIRKDAKKPMMKRLGGGAGSLMSRIPLIGRFFKRKPKTSEDIFSIDDNGVDVE
jgi:hypothetical protein